MWCLTTGALSEYFKPDSLFHNQYGNDKQNYLEEKFLKNSEILNFFSNEPHLISCRLKKIKLRNGIKLFSDIVKSKN